MRQTPIPKRAPASPGAKGVQPPGPPAGLYHRGLAQPAMESPQDHGGGQQRRLVAPRRLEFPQGQPEPVPQPFRLPMGRRPDVHRPAQPRVPRDLLLPKRRLTALIMGQVNVIEDLLFSQAAGNGFTARCLPSFDRERPKPPEDSSNVLPGRTRIPLPTCARWSYAAGRTRTPTRSCCRGVLRRPVIQPEHNARDLLAAASAKFDALADATDNLHERGFWARAQGADGPVRRHPGLRPDAGGRHTQVLGACPLHPPGGRPGRGRHHLARRPDQVLRGPGRLGEDHPAGQRDHHDAPGEEGEGTAKEDGSIAARAVIARMGKAELRTDAGLREQVLDVLVSHRHLIPVARKGHYMMMVPHI